MLTSVIPQIPGVKTRTIAVRLADTSELPLYTSTCCLKQQRPQTPQLFNLVWAHSASD